MKRFITCVVAVIAAVSLVGAGCSSASPAPAPTTAPAAAKPAATTAPAPQATPVATKPAPTTAPAKPAPTAPSAQKVSYPEKGKAITLIVPWAAGSPNDLWARLLANYLEKELGTSIQVVDKPGASSQVGMTELVTSKPDGYTIGVDSMQTTIATYLDPERKAVFGRKEIQPIAVGIYEPFGLVVKGGGPYKTAKDLVDAAKAAPEQLKIGDNGHMSPAHMSVLLLQKAAGIKFANVHFNGSSESVAALLGGHTDGSSIIATGFQGHFKSGELLPLGVFDNEESKAFPGIKPLPAQGYNAVMVRTGGIVAPAGTPMPIVELIAAAMKKVSQNEEFLKKASEAGMVIRHMDTPQYVAHWTEVEQQIKTVLELIKSSS